APDASLREDEVGAGRDRDTRERARDPVARDAGALARDVALGRVHLATEDDREWVASGGRRGGADEPAVLVGGAGELTGRARLAGIGELLASPLSERDRGLRPRRRVAKPAVLRDL